MDLRFGIGFLLFEDRGAHPVAGHGALHENHQPVQPGDSMTAGGNAVNPKLYEVSFFEHAQHPEFKINHESTKKPPCPFSRFPNFPLS
jgi:hypothetical protein